MKKSIACLTVFSLFFSSLSTAQDYIPEGEEAPFTRGALVGEEPDDYRRALMRQKYKNWGIAVGTVVVGIATLILVGKKH